MEKGAFPSDALKHYYTKTPKIHTTVVVGVLKNFRSLGEGEREQGSEEGGGGGKREMVNKE